MAVGLWEEVESVQEEGGGEVVLSFLFVMVS